MTWEGGEMKPGTIAPIEKFLTTYTLASNAPDKEELVNVTFQSGIPVRRLTESKCLWRRLSSH